MLIDESCYGQITIALEGNMCNIFGKDTGFKLSQIVSYDIMNTLRKIELIISFLFIVFLFLFIVLKQ